MSLREPLFALLATLACQGCVPAADTKPDERWLFDRLRSIVKTGKPTQLAIVKAFHLPSACLSKYCEFTLAAGDGLEGTGSLKQSDGGIIFELSKLPATRIRRMQAERYFKLTLPEADCYDAPCWYLNSYNNWGLLAFGVESPSSSYIYSVVVNTKEYGRTISARAKAGANGS